MSNHFSTIATVNLSTVSGGYDVRSAYQAGKTQMQTGRQPPAYQTPSVAFKNAGQTECLLKEAPGGAYGFAEGFVRNSWQQLTAPRSGQ